MPFFRVTVALLIPGNKHWNLTVRLRGNSAINPLRDDVFFTVRRVLAEEALLHRDSSSDATLGLEVERGAQTAEAKIDRRAPPFGGRAKLAPLPLVFGWPNSPGRESP